MRITTLVVSFMLAGCQTPELTDGCDKYLDIVTSAPSKTVETITSGSDYFVWKAQSTTDPLSKELFLRAAADALVRDVATASVQLPAADDEHATRCIGMVDQDNSYWLETVLSNQGWEFSANAKDIGDAAWLLTQHSDRRLEFQQFMLTELKENANTLELDRRKIALLEDRIAINSGELQSYGTQGRCSASGDWRPFQTAAPREEVGALRREVGLPPLEEYIKSMSEFCK